MWLCCSLNTKTHTLKTPQNLKKKQKKLKEQPQNEKPATGTNLALPGRIEAEVGSSTAVPLKDEAHVRHFGKHEHSSFADDGASQVPEMGCLGIEGWHTLRRTV